MVGVFYGGEFWLVFDSKVPPAGIAGWRVSTKCVFPSTIGTALRSALKNNRRWLNGFFGSATDPHFCPRQATEIPPP
jgi:hypothetical protein